MATERITRVNSLSAVYHAPYKTKEDMQSQIEAMQVLLDVVVTDTSDDLAHVLAQSVITRLQDLYKSVNTLTFRGDVDDER